jgi:hypothetical protein
MDMWNNRSPQSAVEPGHFESLRDLQVAQSRLMMEQQQMEIAVMMANNPESPQMPPPSYVAPPPLREIQSHDSVYLSAMELTMMARPPSSVTQPSVHPIHTM